MSIQKPYALLISPSQRISSLSLPACNSFESSLTPWTALDKQDLPNKPCAFKLRVPSASLRPLEQAMQLPLSGTRGRSATHISPGPGSLPHTLPAPVEVGQAHLFPLQHSLGPSEPLMSGSLPCKLQNENTANKKGHCIRSAHLLLT